MPRQVEHVRNILRDRYDSHHCIAALLQIRHHIYFLVQQMWKRMIRIHNLRRQNRKDLFFKIFLYIFLLLLFQLF